jgi:hypothetical protein
LCAAAVIGVFSWPTTKDGYWLAKLLWYCSFFLSTFALISSAQQRLLELIPDFNLKNLSAAELSTLGDLVLVESVNSTAAKKLKPCNGTPDADPEHASQPQKEVSQKMIWIWQSPMMLMSWSWVFFLVGYCLYLLTPLIHGLPWNTDSNVRMTHFCQTFALN